MLGSQYGRWMRTQAPMSREMLLAEASPHLEMQLKTAAAVIWPLLTNWKHWKKVGALLHSPEVHCRRSPREMSTVPKEVEGYLGAPVDLGGLPGQL